MMTDDPNLPGFSCPVPKPPDLSGLTRLHLDPQPPLADYLQAMALANSEAQERLGENMLLS